MNPLIYKKIEVINTGTLAIQQSVQAFRTAENELDDAVTQLRDHIPALSTLLRDVSSYLSNVREHIGEPMDMTLLRSSEPMDMKLPRSKL